MTPAPRHFLLLQGPHGPFFRQLSRLLRKSGARVSRVAFNAGDKAFSDAGANLIEWQGSEQEWADEIGALLVAEGVTDVVVYGETRPRHWTAIAAARLLGLRCHLLEEGYLRPYWVTYERDGTNASSPAASLSISEMSRRQTIGSYPAREPNDRWGDLTSHILWGATYHALLMLKRANFPAYVSHRDGGIPDEFRRYVRRLASSPLRRVRRRLRTAKLLRSGEPFHIALLQLAHDANFRDHGVFPDQTAFLRTVIRGFAEGAPAHHALVIKTHPLEDGRLPLARTLAEIADDFGVRDRVLLIDGGKLARLLNAAKSAVTVNSSAGQQALWRGLPLRSFGRSVYDKPELVSDQALPAFFANPHSPDHEAYQVYRRFLLATSQVEGGFYSQAGRRRLLRQLPDLMLADRNRYDSVQDDAEARPQHLSGV